MDLTLLDRYAQGPRMLRETVAGMSRDQLLARPVAGRWSTLEVVCHVADTDMVYAERIKRVLAENRPTVMAIDPEAYLAALAYHEREAEDELNVLEAVRRQMVRILTVQPADASRREGLHNVSGPFTLEEILGRVTDHLEHHVRFIHEKRQALGLA